MISRNTHVKDTSNGLLLSVSSLHCVVVVSDDWFPESFRLFESGLLVRLSLCLRLSFLGDISNITAYYFVSLQKTRAMTDM